WNCKTPPKIEYASVPSISIIPTLSLPLSILSRNLEILVLSAPGSVTNISLNYKTSSINANVTTFGTQNNHLDFSAATFMLIS
ncbi:DUF3573 domain-containing protein, partial [Francisella tularensis]|uniref:DUF3573 domain-containing protein n=1 Tax=Francisella tularensis TaxID=263 RepID=UPI001F3C18B9